MKAIHYLSSVLVASSLTACFGAGSHTTSPLEAEADANAELAIEQLVGRYVHGDAPVYRGTASAHDDNAQLGGDQPDVAFTSAPALAALELRPAQSGDFPGATGDAAVLTIHATGAHAYVVLEQATGSTTWAGRVLPENTFSSLDVSCDGCAADLHGKPASIAIGEMTASATESGHTIHTIVSADLQHAAPEMLAFADISTLDGPGPFFAGNLQIDGWHAQGGEMVALAHGSAGDGPSGRSCATQTPYTIELFVNATDLQDYGFRNFVAGAPEQECAPQTP